MEHRPREAICMESLSCAALIWLSVCMISFDLHYLDSLAFFKKDICLLASASPPHFAAAHSALALIIYDIHFCGSNAIDILDCLHDKRLCSASFYIENISVRSRQYSALLDDSRSD